MTGKLSINLWQKKHELIFGEKIYYFEGKEKIFDLLAEDLITDVQVMGYDAQPELFMSIMEEIPLHKNIVKVKVSGNRLGEQGIEIIEVLTKSASIREIDVSNNWLRGYGLQVVKALTKSLSIHTFDMSSNDIRSVEKELIESYWSESDLHKEREYFKLLKEMSKDENSIFGQYALATDTLGVISKFAVSSVELYIDDYST